MKKQEIWRELAQRELARRSFAEYLAYVQGRNAAMRHRINLAETKETIFALLDELVCSIHEYEKSAPENRAHII